MRAAGVQDIERAAQAFASIIAEHIVRAEPGLREDAVTDSVAAELLLAVQDAVDVFVPPDMADLPVLSAGEESFVRAFLSVFDSEDGAS